MSKNRNRSAGHGWEREIVEHMRKVGYEKAETSRYASRMLDDAKVDIAFCDPFLIQAKNLNGRAKYEQILQEMPENGIRVILQKMTRKANKNFKEIGRYAILDYNDFLNIVYTLKKYKIDQIERLF